MSDLPLPLVQSEAFERTCRRLDIPVHRINAATGTCLIQSRKLPVIGHVHLISRGPVAETDSDYALCVDLARAQVKGPLVINAGSSCVHVRGLKFARGAELAIVDLTLPGTMRATLHQKWRNQLKKAEAAGLVVTQELLDAERHDWFLRAELKQQKTRGYRNYPPELLLAFAAANKEQACVYTASLNGVPVAAMLALQHGRMATYQSGLTTELGRRTCAHNLLMWQMMCDLQDRGVAHLDLGRVDLSDGLRRFKLGTGARVEVLAGSYVSLHAGRRQHNRDSARAGFNPAP